MIYYHNNWSLENKYKFINLYKYLIWSGFETKGINLYIIIQYFKQLNISILVANYPNIIYINKSIGMGLFSPWCF